MGERRLRGTGSIYQRSDGRYAYTVDLGWSGGARRRRTVTARTLAELKPKIKKLDRTLAAGLQRDGSTTVEAWLRYWLAEVAPRRVRPRTLKGYSGYVNTWLIPNLGKHRLDMLEASHVRALHRTMEKAGKSHATIRQAHMILSRALNVALDDGKIIRNPCRSAELPKATSKGTHGKLTLAEALTVLHHLEDDERGARWVVALLTGLRQGEALGLAWENVDLDRRVLYVLNAQQRIDGALTLTDVKSESSVRAVHLLPEVHLALARRRVSRPDDVLVFGPRDNKADWKEWQAILAECGIPHRTVHAARATTATLLDAAGVSPKMIAEILGHSRADVTMHHYVHGDDEMHREAFDKMGVLIHSTVDKKDALAP